MKTKALDAWTLECPVCLSSNGMVLQVGRHVSALLWKCLNCFSASNFIGPRIEDDGIRNCIRCKQDFRAPDQALWTHVCPPCTVALARKMTDSGAEETLEAIGGKIERDAYGTGKFTLQK